MIRKSASYSEHVPTREEARLLTEKKKAEERARQNSTRRTVRPASTASTAQKKSTLQGAKSRAAAEKKGTPKKRVKKKDHEMSTKKLILLIALIILSFAGITSGILFALSRTVPADSPLALVSSVTIEKGESAQEVAQALVASRVIESSEEFMNLVEDRGLATSLRAGDYLFEEYSEVESVLDALTVGFTDLTIFPGESISDIDRRLTSRGLIGEGAFISAMNAVCEERTLPFSEGFIAGGTYRQVPKGNLALNLAYLSVDSLFQIIRRNADILNESELSTIEVVIIASMVQRETTDPGQMRTIAGVILNRLRIGEPLGIDATTRYAISDWVNPLTKDDFARAGQYDTRRRKGLPPSGLGAVSEEAFSAVLSPEEHGYLFYLHDEEGNLHPSFTYEEHLSLSERFLGE